MNRRIKTLMAACVAAILSVSVAAQEHATGISLKAVVVDDDIPTAAVKNIETKLQRALASNGIGDMDYTQRFVLAAKVDVVQNDVMPSNPPRVSKKLDLTLMVGDVIENKIYETCTMSLAGIGTNDAKAFVSAFSRVNPNNEDLQTMLAAAKEEIMAYYENNCDYIISNANSLAGQQKYDEAIARLMSQFVGWAAEIRRGDSKADVCPRGLQGLLREMPDCSSEHIRAAARCGLFGSAE